MVFIQGKYELTDRDRDDVETLGFRIIQNDDIVEISGNRNGYIEKIRCQSGKYYDTDVIFYHLGYKVENQIAIQLGCELDREEGFVKVNSSQQTTVRNVYAIGECCYTNSTFIFKYFAVAYPPEPNLGNQPVEVRNFQDAKGQRVMNCIQEYDAIKYLKKRNDNS